MARTTVLVMVDGLDPTYLDSCPAPNFRELAKKGFQTEVRAMMPTVTNVNNTSLVTNSYPESHGITSNYWLDQESGSEHYMESGEYIQAETMFQRATRQGARSLLVSSKDKLRRLLGDGATVAFSSEEPDSRVVDAIGQPPPVYSLEVNGWIVDAARHVLAQESYDLVYLTTTDYAMHTYAPEQPESSDHLALLDRAVGLLMESLPDAEILITADHGMSSKSRMIHLPAELEQHGIQARAVPIIKDLYTVHHSNLGGCIYLYLDQRDQERALGILNNVDGVDQALDREAAAKRFRLMGSRIGDIMVLGAADVVFGDPAEVTMPSSLRSHGSLYEEMVPVIGCGGDFDGFDFLENKDLGRYVFERVLP
ncbi:MAG: alkaline phosphatase family protein [Stenotrophomonas maltophilia]